MAIDDLKSLMDDFDPSTLLPDLAAFSQKLPALLRFVVLIGPLILLVLGLLYLFASPREANYHFGYRCYFGMGSVDAWRYTQRLAGVVLGSLGLLLTIIMLIRTAGFSGVETTDMVWTAVSCVIWEAVLTAVSCLAIHILVAVRFDRAGELRKVKQ